MFYSITRQLPEYLYCLVLNYHHQYNSRNLLKPSFSDFVEP